MSKKIEEIKKPERRENGKEIIKAVEESLINKIIKGGLCYENKFAL